MQPARAESPATCEASLEREASRAEREATPAEREATRAEEEREETPCDKGLASTTLLRKVRR